MQALARFRGQRREAFEADRRVDQVAQDQPGGLRFIVEKQSDSFVQQSLAKGWVAPHARRNRLFKVAGERTAPNSSSLPNACKEMAKCTLLHWLAPLSSTDYTDYADSYANRSAISSSKLLADLGHIVSRSIQAAFQPLWHWLSQVSDLAVLRFQE
jgi:hypothetical protein